MKGSTASREGFYEFSAIPPGKYLLLFSGLGHTDRYGKSFELDKEDKYFPPVTLIEESKELATVTVSARKPLFEQKIDRMVVNVKNSLTNVGASVLDVLERSPGILVNRNMGTISMSGKAGVKIMINGKMNYLQPEALVSFLQGLNASNVEKIELITAPPAQYDADGNAGMINIVLINNPDEGFSGNVSISMAVGTMEGTEPMGSVNMNFRKGPLNIYGAYSFSRLQQKQVATIERHILKSGDDHSVMNSSDRDPFQRNHDYRIGLDYAINKRTILGFILGGYNHRWEMDAVNHSYYKINELADTAIIINNQELNYRRHGMANANLTHNFREGEQLTFNLDFLRYNDSNPTQYQQNFYDGNNQFLFDQDMNSGKETKINILATQLDYSKKLNDKLTLQTGLKGAQYRFNNVVLVEREVNNEWIADPGYTANYRLREDVGAAYASVDFSIDSKTNGKAGLRFEYTESNLNSDQKADIVDRKYGKFFPSLYISRSISENSKLNVNYTKRITRPTFNDLAPFLIFFDPKTFLSGNAALQPAIAHNFKIDLLVKKLVFGIAYNYELYKIARFQTEFDTATNVQTMTAQNLDKAHLASASATLPVDITKWWTSSLTAELYWQKIYAHFDNGPSVGDHWYYMLSGTESFRLPKKFSLELSGFYVSKNLYGTAAYDGLGVLNIALQKKIHQEQWSVTAGVDDIFSSFKFGFSTRYPEQQTSSYTSIHFKYRMFKLGLNIRFGNKLLKGKRERITASEDEQKRVQ